MPLREIRCFFTFKCRGDHYKLQLNDINLSGRLILNSTNIKRPLHEICYFLYLNVEATTRNGPRCFENVNNSGVLH